MDEYVVIHKLSHQCIVSAKEISTHYVFYYDDYVVFSVVNTYCSFTMDNS